MYTIVWGCVDATSGFWLVASTAVSSAKAAVVDVGISSVKIWYIIGPSTLPWGTPDLIPRIVDSSCSYFTWKYISDRKN